MSFVRALPYCIQLRPSYPSGADTHGQLGGRCHTGAAVWPDSASRYPLEGAVFALRGRHCGVCGASPIGRCHDGFDDPANEKHGKGQGAPRAHH